MANPWDNDPIVTPAAPAPAPTVAPTHVAASAPWENDPIVTPAPAPKASAPAAPWENDPIVQPATPAASPKLAAATPAPWESDPIVQSAPAPTPSPIAALADVAGPLDAPTDQNVRQQFSTPPAAAAPSSPLLAPLETGARIADDVGNAASAVGYQAKKSAIGLGKMLVEHQPPGAPGAGILPSYPNPAEEQAAGEAVRPAMERAAAGEQQALSQIHDPAIRAVAPNVLPLATMMIPGAGVPLAAAMEAGSTYADTGSSLPRALAAGALTGAAGAVPIEKLGRAVAPVAERLVGRAAAPVVARAGVAAGVGGVQALGSEVSEKILSGKPIDWGRVLGGAGTMAAFDLGMQWLHAAFKDRPIPQERIQELRKRTVGEGAGGEGGGSSSSSPPEITPKTQATPAGGAENGGGVSSPSTPPKEVPNDDVVGAGHPAQERVVAGGGGESRAGEGGGGGAAVAGDVQKVGAGVGPVVGAEGQAARPEPGNVGGEGRADGAGDSGGGIDADQQAFQRFVRDRDQQQFREFLNQQGGEGSAPAAEQPPPERVAPPADRGQQDGQQQADAQRVGTEPAAATVQAEPPAASVAESRAASDTEPAPLAEPAGDNFTKPPERAVSIDTPIASTEPPPPMSKVDAVEAWVNKRLKEKAAAQSKALAGATPQLRRYRGSAGSLDPETLALYAVKGAVHVARGVKSFAEFSKTMAADLGDAAAEYLPKVWQQAKRLSRMGEEDQAAWMNKQFTVPGTGESTMETVRRTTGQYRPETVRGDMARLKMQIRTSARASAQGYEAGVAEATKLKTELARTLTENLPPERRGDLLADVAKATTLSDVYRAINKATGVLADSELDRHLAKVETMAGRLKLDPVEGPKNQPNPPPQDGATIPGPKPLDPAKTPLKTVRKIDPALRAQVAELMDQAKLIKAKAARGVYGTVEEKTAAAGELDRIAGEMGRLVHENNHANAVRIRGKVVELQQAVGEASRSVVASRKALKQPENAVGPGKPNPVHMIYRKLLNPETLLYTLDNGKEGTLTDLGVNQIRRAREGQLGEERRWTEHLGTMLEGAGYEPGSVRLRDFMEKPEAVELPDAGKVKLTRNELVGLHATLSDPSTLELVSEGVPVTLASDPRAEPLRLTGRDIDAIAAALTPGERAMPDGFSSYNAEEITNRLMNATYELTGTAPDPTEGYFPRKRNMAQSDAAGQAPGWRGEWKKAVESISSTKERGRDTRTPLAVDGFIQTTDRYVRDAAKVIHLGEPVRSLSAVIENPEVANAIARHYGDTVNKQIQTYLKNLVGGDNHARSPLTDAVTRQVARSALPLNPSSILKNLGGGTAKLIGEFDLEDFAAGVRKMFDGDTYRRMLAASNVAWDRYDRGLARQVFTIAGGQPDTVANLTFKEAAKRLLSTNPLRHPGRAVGRLGEVTDAIPFFEWADSVPLRAAWAAAEHYVERTMPGATAKEKAAAVLAKWTAAIQRTQNGNSPTEISDVAANVRGTAWSPLLMFKSDSNKSLQMIVRGAMAGGKERNRAVLAVLASMGVNAAVGTLLGYGVVKGTRALVGKGTTEGEDVDAIGGAAGNAVKDAMGLAYADLAYRYIQAAMRPTGYPSSNTPHEDLAQRLSEGLIDVARAAHSAYAGDVLKSGPHRGEMQAKQEFLRGLKKLADGARTVIGDPTVPVTRLASRAYDTATTDVEEKAYQERRKQH